MKRLKNCLLDILEILFIYFVKILKKINIFKIELICNYISEILLNLFYKIKNIKMFQCFYNFLMDILEANILYYNMYLGELFPEEEDKKVYDIKNKNLRSKM